QPLWFSPSTTPDTRFLQAFLAHFSIRCTQTEKKYTGGVLALHVKNMLPQSEEEKPWKLSIELEWRRSTVIG
ncbi:hypothetical protein TNCV_1317651, partial [Trichonephila clavipes]